MNDVFVNRLAMFQRCLGTLHAAEHRSVWFEQPPVAFTAKVNQADEAVSSLEAFCRDQERDITGAAQQKRRAASELEEAAHLTASALAIWYREQGNESRSSEVDLTRSDWRRLRDQQFLEKCRLVFNLAKSATVGAEAEGVAEYGVTTEAVESFGRALEAYTALITAPQRSLADRKTHTEQLRDRFNAVEAQFDVLDRLILHFGRSAAGRDLIATYQAARVIRDQGSRSNRAADAVATPEPALSAS